jgi:hypothetical protein
MKKYVNGSWHYTIADQACLTLARQYMTGHYEIEKTFKSNRKSLVQKIIIDEQPLVAKRIKKLNINHRPRLMNVIKQNLFGSFEASMFNHMVFFLKNGILTTIPVAVFEKRKYGILRDAVLLMRYEPSYRLAKQADSQTIIQCLKQFHRLGYLHGDPDLGNFFKTERGLLAVDYVPRKNWMGQLGASYELFKFTRQLKAMPHNIPSHHWSFKIAGCYYRTFRRIRYYWKNFYRRFYKR